MDEMAYFCGSGASHDSLRTVRGEVFEATVAPRTTVSRRQRGSADEVSSTEAVAHLLEENASMRRVRPGRRRAYGRACRRAVGQQREHMGERRAGSRFAAG